MYKLHSYTNAVDRHSRIHMAITGDYLEKIISQIKAIPKEITIKNVLRIKLESGCACGGIVFKPYVKNGVILPDCITQDNFIEAIQKQCSIKNAAGKTLLDAYKHEGFQEEIRYCLHQPV